MDKQRNDKLIEIYKNGLLEDTLPFWIKHSIDEEQGGFIIALDKDGSVLDTDKPMWIQSRFVWLLSTLYNKVEKKQQWLDLAKHGVDFVTKHGFDKDGRMFFKVVISDNYSYLRRQIKFPDIRQRQ